MKASRQQFEALVTAPPMERSIARQPDDPKVAAWPGQYRDFVVQFAWDVLVDLGLANDGPPQSIEALVPEAEAAKATEYLKTLGQSPPVPDSLYACSRPWCREECSWPSDLLFHYAPENAWVCDNCWDELPRDSKTDELPTKSLTLKTFIALTKCQHS